MQIKDIMTTRVVTVEMDDKLSAVKEIFDQLKFHHVLVNDNNRLYGVISDRDLLKAISHNIGTMTETYKDAATLNKRVHQIMSRNPVTLTPEASIRDAVHLFNQHTISCIPIVDKDFCAVGIVSWRDIMRHISRI